MALSNLNGEPASAKRGPDCSVCQALEILPKKEAGTLRGALANPRWRFSEIAEAVASDPEVPQWIRDINGQTYRRHARGQCAARVRLR